MLLTNAPSTRDTQLFISGEVQLHTGAMVASGVVLQAEAGCRIVIENGTCIGLGSVIHASTGSIVISEGAILGSGVLLVGSVTVGVNACIGAATTVMDAAIAPGMMVPSGSLILSDPQTTVEFSAKFSSISVESPAASLEVAEQSFHVKTTTSASAAPEPPSSENADPWGDETTPTEHSEQTTPAFTSEINSGSSVQSQNSATQPVPEEKPTDNAMPPVSTAEVQTETRLGSTAIYGKFKLNKLLTTLLPHRQWDSPNAPSFSSDEDE